MTASATSIAVDLERPVFIIGVGRSGTSLLQSMLDAHPDLAFTPETHFYRRYVADVVQRTKLEGRGVLAFMRLIETDAEFARAGVPMEALVDRGDLLDLEEVFRRLLERAALIRGKCRVGDKDPRNIDYLPALARSFPQALVLHVVRDPRDVVLSRTKAAWSAARPWWVHPLIYREQLRRGRRLGPRLFGPRYLELAYEDLISSPAEALHRVCEHVGLDYSPEMLEFGESARRLVDERELQWKKETLGPLLARNSGKWREGLSSAQVSFTEAVCREAFEQLGYERAGGSFSPWHLAAPLLVPGSRLAYDWKLRRRA